MEGPYKLQTKVLANELKKVMEKWCQNPNMHLLRVDKFWTQSLWQMKSMTQLKGSKNGVIWNMDIEKAYDHVP